MLLGVVVHPRAYALELQAPSTYPGDDHAGRREVVERVARNVAFLRHRCLERGGLFLSHEGLPELLHPSMPPPSPDLRVIVCGAYSGVCVAEQQEALKAAGYRSRIWRAASLPTVTLAPGDWLEDAGYVTETGARYSRDGTRRCDPDTAYEK